MSKTTNTLILGMLFFASTLWGQLATWSLSTDGSPTTVTANVIAGDFVRGNGIGQIQYSSDGGKARGWTTETTANTVDFYEVCISPQAGYVLHITDLNFSEMRTELGITEYEVFWSKDNFTRSESILQATIPDDISERSTSISNLDIYVCDDETLCFRWYAYAAEHPSGEWRINDNSLNIDGTVSAACTPPATQASGLSFGNITTNSMQLDFNAGSGNSRLVVMKQGSAVTARPCFGASYTADATFGDGAEIGADEFVVYNGTGNSVVVNNLIEGANYHVAVFEYDNSGNCYKRTNPDTGFHATQCFSPTDVTANIGSPGNGIVTLAWEVPTCFDEVLIIASTSAIVGIPAGDGSNYSPMAEYGLGTDIGNDFSGAEFPIYKGTGTEMEVSGLTNETAYYFKIFTRKGNDWSNGVEFSIKPTGGCTDLGGYDRVFISEMHYRNVGTDQDEGVEVYGPAGTSLDIYQVVLYDGITRLPTVTIPLSGVIDNEVDGYGAVWVPAPDMIDGKGGIALYNSLTKMVVQLLSYRGSFLADGGVAEGMVAENVTKFENVITPVGYSIQLTGEGHCPADLQWAGPIPHTMGDLNAGQFILPIELTDFYATKRGEQVQLNWETAVEIDNDYMVVERSRDGYQFEDLGKVKGAGTTNIPQFYSLMDSRPYFGLNYYRLRQVDFDGTVTYHKVVVVDMQKETRPMEVFPTVTRAEVNLRFEEALSEQTTLSIYSLTGQLIQEVNLDADTFQYQLDVSKLTNGQYFIRMQSNGNIETARFIKM